MSIAAPRIARPALVVPPHSGVMVAAIADDDARRAPSPIFRGMLFAGLFSLPFLGGAAVVVSLIVR